MRRLFPILAGLAGLLLIATLVRGPSGFFGGLAVAATLGVHALVFLYLEAIGRRIEAKAARVGLPDWVRAQVAKNRRKALVYEGWGAALVVLAWGLGSGSWGLLVLSNANLAFQVGAFAGEFAIVGAQARLIRDVGTRAEDREAA